MQVVNFAAREISMRGIDEMVEKTAFHCERMQPTKSGVFLVFIVISI